MPWRRRRAVVRTIRVRLQQRRADAVGPVARLESQLACLCGLPDRPAGQKRAAANAAVIHVLADHATWMAPPMIRAIYPAMGSCPPRACETWPLWPSSAVARAADLKPGRRRPTCLSRPNPSAVTEPDKAADTAELERTDRRSADTCEPAKSENSEPGYRPSVALSEFIRWRDLTCRFPGCDAPAARCDIDHTMPYPLGPTHPSNTKLYCRTHHLVKTFCPGWSDRQLPDGTVEITAPTGHTYVTEPHGAGLFPTLSQPTGELNLPEPPAASPDRAAMMPTRRQTREQDRKDRITAERRQRAELNNDLEVERQYQAWLAEEYWTAPTVLNGAARLHSPVSFNADAGHSLTAWRAWSISSSGTSVDEDFDHTVVVLVEDDVGDHHAVARCDAGVLICFYFHGIHHVTANDLSP